MGLRSGRKSQASSTWLRRRRRESILAHPELLCRGECDFVRLGTAGHGRGISGRGATIGGGFLWCRGNCAVDHRARVEPRRRRRQRLRRQCRTGRRVFPGDDPFLPQAWMVAGAKHASSAFSLIATARPAASAPLSVWSPSASQHAPSPGCCASSIFASSHTTRSSVPLKPPKSAPRSFPSKSFSRALRRRVAPSAALGRNRRHGHRPAHRANKAQRLSSTQPAEKSSEKMK